MPVLKLVRKMLLITTRDPKKPPPKMKEVDNDGEEEVKKVKGKGKGKGKVLRSLKKKRK